MINFRPHYLSLFSIRTEFNFSDRQIYWKDMGNFFLMFWTTSKTFLNLISNNKIIFMIPDLCNIIFYFMIQGRSARSSKNQNKTLNTYMILEIFSFTFLHSLKSEFPYCPCKFWNYYITFITRIKVIKW